MERAERLHVPCLDRRLRLECSSIVAHDRVIAEGSLSKEA